MTRLRPAQIEADPGAHVPLLSFRGEPARLKTFEELFHDAYAHREYTATTEPFMLLHMLSSLERSGLLAKQQDRHFGLTTNGRAEMLRLLTAIDRRWSEPPLVRRTYDKATLTVKTRLEDQAPEYLVRMGLVSAAHLVTPPAIETLVTSIRQGNDVVMIVPANEAFMRAEQGFTAVGGHLSVSQAFDGKVQLVIQDAAAVLERRAPVLQRVLGPDLLKTVRDQTAPAHHTWDDANHSREQYGLAPVHRPLSRPTAVHGDRAHLLQHPSLIREAAFVRVTPPLTLVPPLPPTD